MGILSDKKIKQRLSKEGDLEILIANQAIDQGRVEECSINLTLSNEFMRIRAPWPFRVLDLLHTQKDDFENKWCRKVTTNAKKGFFLRSNELVLARTVERLVIPSDILVQVTGRSTYSRLGLEVQLTQDFKMPEDDSIIIFQIKNNSNFPIRLYPGMRILQIFFHEIHEGCEMTYSNKGTANYCKQHEIGPSKFYQSPEYENIRKEGDKLKQSKTDWDHVLNVSLILAGIISICAIYEAIASEKLSKGSILVLAITTLVLIIRSIRLYNSRKE